MIDIKLLAEPLSGEDPCGPDLDSEGDLDYLNFFASAESLLPMSYFEVKDSDGNTINPSGFNVTRSYINITGNLNHIVSFRITPPSLVVTAESEIPAAYWKPQPPKLNRQSLTAALRNGEHVPGAVLGNGQSTISVRTR